MVEYNRNNGIAETDNTRNDDENVNTSVEANNDDKPVPGLNPRDEETATELTADDGLDDSVTTDENDVDMGIQVNSIVGWVGLALSILSFFLIPIILGGAGIIVGFIARNRDAEWLGNTAIAAGVISILLTLFFRPFV